MRAGTDPHAIGVAGDQAHAVRANPEPFTDQLSIARLVALPTRQGTDHHLDGALRVRGDLGHFAGQVGNGLVSWICLTTSGKVLM